MRPLIALLLCLMATPAWADALIEVDGCFLAKGYNAEAEGPKLFEPSYRFDSSVIVASQIASYRTFMLVPGSKDCIQILLKAGFTIFVEIESPRREGESSGQALRRIMQETIGEQ